MAEFNSEKALVFEWKIKNFSLYTFKLNEFIDSDKFTMRRIPFFVRFLLRLNKPCSLSIRKMIDYSNSYHYEEEHLNLKYSFEVVCYENSFYKSDPIIHRFEHYDSSSPEWFGIESFEYILKNNNLFLNKDCFTIKVYLWGAYLKGLRFQEMHCCTKLKTGEKCTLEWKIGKLNSPVTLSKTVCFPSGFYYDIKLVYDVIQGMQIMISTKNSEKILKAEVFLCNDSKYNRILKIKDCQMVSRGKVWELPITLTEEEQNNSICLEIKLYLLSIETESIKETRIKSCDCYNIVSSTSDRYNLEHMYKSKKMTDVKFHVDGKTLLAHKLILVSRSPVFSAMFEQEMAEKKSNTIHINDMSYNTLNEFLLFLYGAELNLNYLKAIQLINAAEKYQVLPLKEECAQFLASCLSNENFDEILSVTKFIQAENLKLTIINFIKAHQNLILSSDKWKEFSKSNPELALEVMTKLVSHI